MCFSIRGRTFSTASKFYVLAQFPYPSGALHMGHVRVYTIADVIARHRKLLGHQVINPMGWDAFGLPAENAAMSRGIGASEWTMQNIKQMREQLKGLTLDIDWDREFATCDPEYYKWTQWIFLQLYKRGLAYQAEAQVNWDPVDQTVLADEQIDKNGKSWRSGALVEKRSLRQWFFRITRYAKELNEGLDTLPAWPNSVKQMQRNWIGLKTDELGQINSLKIRDWLISRQRKWGTPIPIVHCRSCGVVPVPEEALPVMHSSNHSCSCPKCGGSARMETDTMDTFVDSSWYFLRFLDPKNVSRFCADELLSKWMPVDVYIGGIEHAIMHLLYARFINRSLADIISETTGRNSLPAEPFKQLICQGLVEGKTFQCLSTGKYLQPHEYKTENGKTVMVSDGQECKESWEKMSKSKYNGVDPTHLVAKYGADALRLYMMFKAPPEIPLAWSEREIVGPVRWLERLGNLASHIRSHQSSSDSSDSELIKARDEALRKVNRAFDLKTHNFNTAVAALMKLTNTIEDCLPTASSELLQRTLLDLAVMLSPMAPSKAADIYLSLTNQQLDPRCIRWPELNHQPSCTTDKIQK